MSLETRIQALEADKQASTPINLLPNMGVLEAGALITVYSNQRQRAEYINESAFGGGGSDPTNNVKIKTLYVPVDFNAPTKVDSQIVNYINSLPTFTVDGNTLQTFISYKFTSQGSFSSVETHLYALKSGKGSYGTGTTLSPYDVQLLSITNQSDSTSNIYDLGEIGDVDPIEDVVNTTGSYDVFNGVLNVFKTTRSGVEFDYIYTGNATKIGLGETPTLNSDYIDLNSVTPSTPAPTASYYDTFFYKDSFANDLSNFTSNTPFNVAKTLDGTFYFISKATNIETFEYTRLFFLDANVFVNLGSDPDIEDAAFLAWQIQPINSLVNGQTYLFNRWMKKGGGTGNISQGVDSTQDIDYISLVKENEYPVGAEIPDTLYAVEQETTPTGYEQIFLAAGQSITASTDTIISFTGGNFSSDGGFSLFNSDGKIIPLQENDVITYDISFEFSTPSTQGNYDVWIDVNGTRYRSVTKQMLKSNGVIDYFSASFILPIGSDFFTNGGNIYINSSQAITISNKYCISSRVHKASLV